MTGSTFTEKVMKDKIDPEKSRQRDIKYNIEFGHFRKYGHSRYEYLPPQSKKLSEYKRKLISNGLPVTLECGIIIVNDRGDLVVNYNDGNSLYYIDASETIK